MDVPTLVLIKLSDPTIIVISPPADTEYDPIFCTAIDTPEGVAVTSGKNIVTEA